MVIRERNNNCFHSKWWWVDFLCDALSKCNEIKYICCHHEQAVSFAAEGYARAGKSIGVGLVTTGPGGTNVLTGLSAAWIDSVPMLIISGQVYSKQTIGGTKLRQLGVQDLILSNCQNL